METLWGASVEDQAVATVAAVRAIVDRHGGTERSCRRGEVWASFASVDAAAEAAVAVRVMPGAAPAVAIHVGRARSAADRAIGARVLEAANPGQILLTGATCDALGDRSGRVVDLGLHELAEADAPVRLFGLVDERLLDATRPPRARRLRLGELPEPVSVLVGRERDVDELVDLLARRRLVTLTGVGGIGKTRLAVEVARRLEERVREGVCLVRLESCRTDDDVVTSALAAAGIDAPSAGQWRIGALVDGLHDRHALIVVDNCEHVIGAAGRLVSAVLAGCRHVRVLATSREALDVDGEWVHAVTPLDTADDGHAVALFVERANAAGAQLDVTAERAAVGRVCRRVDGIPLAIELAAARCRLRRPDDLLVALDDMLGALGSAGRAAPARHRTMAAALRWSYDLLPFREQLLLARASVFRGSFALDAAAAICAGGPISAEAVPALVEHLVSSSLLEPVVDGPGSRARMLEPVRQFAADQLTPADAAATGGRHTAWFVALMSDLGARWRAGDDQTTWPIAAVELPNLRAAFDRLIETWRIDDAERFAVDGYGPVDMHVEPLAEFDWAPRVLALDPAHVGPATAAACGIAAWAVLDVDDPRAATALIRRGEAALRRGSVDDGLFTACALHQRRFGAPPSTSPGLLEGSIAAALAGDDLHRKVWVGSYVASGDVVLEAAERLGNVMLLALARSRVARQLLDGGRRDTAECAAAIESFWEVAQRSNCALMADHAGQMLGDARIRAGAIVDGLALQRAPLHDWYLGGDIRAWDVLRSIATGLADAGDCVGAARILGALGERRSMFSTAGTVAETEARIGAALPADVRRRHERAGQCLGLGDLVAEAIERIDALAGDTGGPPTATRGALTARQREIADLVAEGLTNKQIAATLGLSRLTVETHVRNILERLGAQRRSQIAAWSVAAATHT